MKIQAINNHILFQFVDKVTNGGMFDGGVSKHGIILDSNHKDSSASPRWGRIISLGPDCSDELRVKGCEVLIEKMKWTVGTKFNNTIIWRTDETQLLGYRYPESN